MVTPNWFDKSLVGGRTVGSALADSWLPPGQTGIMIPYYFYPNNPYSDATVAQLLGLIRQYRGQVPVIVIINAGNGPGVVTDGNYTAFIRVLQAAGAKVAGYVSTDYGARAESAVQADVDLWLTLYPNPKIDTIFYDEQTYDLGVGNANVLLYERYTSYCHARGLAPVIANPGTNQQGAYFATRTADIIVTVESGTWPTETDLRGNFVGGHTDYSTALRAALIYGQATMTVADVRTLAKYVRWVYITHDALSPNPWDSLSTHLGDLFAVLASQNSTDAYLLARANHTGTQAISTVASLQTSLDAKAPLASPTFTGTVTAPTLTVTGTATAGAFSGPLTGAVTGNASTATTLQTSRLINGVAFNGSASITVTANTPNTLTRGAYLTGSNFTGSAATTWAVDADSANVASKIVARDASGNFSAGTITAALTGNASTATSAATLTTPRNINGVSFNGSANITVTANTPNTLTRGTYLTGADFNGSAASTWAVDATNLNTASKIVARDASGNFAAGTITANLTGNVTGNVTGNLGGSTVTASGTVTAARFVTTAGATLTIAAGVVTATNGLHTIDTEAAAATDDLDTINGGVAGMVLILRAGSSTRDVVCKDGTGNLRLAGDFTLTHTDDRLVLLSDGVNWFELSRADNNL